MAKVKEIADHLLELVPQEMKSEYDNVGLLVGIEGALVTRAIVALDVTPTVISEAENIGAQLIVAHHPLFFDLKSVNDSDPTGSSIIRILRSGISCICLHTNLDSVRGGVNDALAEKLGVAAERYLEGPFYTSEGKEYGMGRIGRISSPMEMSEFLPRVKTALNANGLRYHDSGKPVYKVALCGGSGGDFVKLAPSLGFDTLVTADVKYHQFLDARAFGLNLIDAGHFSTENVVVPVLAEMIKREFPSVKVSVSSQWKQTDKYF